MRKDIAEFSIDLEKVPYNRVSKERILWGFQDLDYYTKGIEVGLTVIQADTNMGKSLFTMQVLKNVAKQGYMSCVFAGEHTDDTYKNLIMQQNGKKGEFVLVPFKDTTGKDTNIADWYVNEEIEKLTNANLCSKVKLFATKKQDRDLGTILDWIEYENTVNKCKFCLLDNFMEIDNDLNDLNRGQTIMLTKIRNKILQLGMMCVLIMHINKESTSNGFRLNLNSASGTKNGANKAYNVISQYRKDCIFVPKGQEKMLERFKEDCAKCGYDYDKCDGFLEVNKSKGNGNGIVGLIYDSETKTYSQAPKITKTEADRIIKTTYKQQAVSFDDLIPIDDDGSLPF